MEEQTRRELLEKNERLIQMVIERARRDFPDDIALIGLTGSFSTGDYHEKSDLDLLIVNNTPRGHKISRCFILGDVGYDFYCTPWETRIEAQSKLESPMVSHLTDLKVLYVSKPEDLERLNACRKKALDLLAKPLGAPALERAKKGLERAKGRFADAMLAEAPGPVRYAAGRMVDEVVNVLTHLNNTYIKKGVKRYLEELSGYQHLPDGFPQCFLAVAQAKTMEEVRAACRELLRGVTLLYERMARELLERPIPTRDSLRGSYEELWCNYRNKMLSCTASGDPFAVFLMAVGAQGYLDEMAEEKGTRTFDLLQYYDAENLPLVRDTFLRMMDEYREEYVHVGLDVEWYGTFEELYESFMAGQ